MCIYVSTILYILNNILNLFPFSGSTQRLTYAHKGGRNLADDPLAAGIPSYVMQEEFNRYQGYWWQPVTEGKLRFSIYVFYSFF